MGKSQSQKRRKAERRRRKKAAYDKLRAVGVLESGQRFMHYPRQNGKRNLLGLESIAAMFWNQAAEEEQERLRLREELRRLQ